jgi:Fe-S oxidoreductase
MFFELKKYLLAHGVKKVIVACPNCYKVFHQYGGELAVTTAYEALLDDAGLPALARVNGAVTVHDPCAIRFESAIHDAARDLLAQKGLQVEEMKHHHRRRSAAGKGARWAFSPPSYLRTEAECERKRPREGQS